jgi:hypothetical protein
MPIENVIINIVKIKSGKEAVEILNENINRFKAYMQKMDFHANENNLDNLLEGDQEVDKVKCLKNFKALLSIFFIFFI